VSDKFFQVATKEVNEAIESIGKILESSKDDSGINKNIESIKIHIHKLKGLAPMMNQLEIGEIASLNDKILKNIINGIQHEGAYKIFLESNIFMKNSMTGPASDFVKLKQKMEKNFHIS